jgi:hypothetical protein
MRRFVSVRVQVLLAAILFGPIIGCPGVLDHTAFDVPRIGAMGVGVRSETDAREKIVANQDRLVAIMREKAATPLVSYREGDDPSAGEIKRRAVSWDELDLLVKYMTVERYANLEGPTVPHIRRRASTKTPRGTVVWIDFVTAEGMSPADELRFFLDRDGNIYGWDSLFASGPPPKAP